MLNYEIVGLVKKLCEYVNKSLTNLMEHPAEEESKLRSKRAYLNPGKLYGNNEAIEKNTRKGKKTKSIDFFYWSFNQNNQYIFDGS